MTRNFVLPDNSISSYERYLGGTQAPHGRLKSDSAVDDKSQKQSSQIDRQGALGPGDLLAGH